MQSRLHIDLRTYRVIDFQTKYGTEPTHTHPRLYCILANIHWILYTLCHIYISNILLGKELCKKYSQQRTW